MAALNPTPAESARMRVALRIPYCIEDMDDEPLITLLESNVEELSPLELELLVRLGAAWETIRRMDADALAQGVTLN